ncbi:MAG: aspartate aminotransferase family protein [Chloroflexi bacterium]|nr:aspartate aminotransferase family protein [Chloroflexota bacterium]
MAVVDSSVAGIEREYTERHKGSKALYEEAVQVFVGGVTHDGRFARPFPIYVDRAKGSRKWDVDGNEYVDYWMGHGSLILGHSAEPVVEAVTNQVAKGTHLGACHELEVRWGALIKKLVPCAEAVRFFSSGTEATLMAMRLSRAYTGRSKVMKFEGHFHGWHDYVMAGMAPPYDVPASIGIPEATIQTVVVAPPNDMDEADRLLGANPDIACVILEPSGASFGTVPLHKEQLLQLREITRRHQVVLVFDEVITGFRFAPGGVQEYHGITPDLTTLAKIVAGGLPGGAVVGRREIFDSYAFTSDAEHNRYHRTPHQGTYNANPLSAAAGIAALNVVGRGEVQKYAHRLGDQLRAGMNKAISEAGVKGSCAYGASSIFHVLLGSECDFQSDCDFTHCRYDPVKLMMRMKSPLKESFRQSMLNHGVDFMGGHEGFTSSAHTEADVRFTLDAFGSTLEELKKAGLL